MVSRTLLFRTLSEVCRAKRTRLTLIGDLTFSANFSVFAILITLLTNFRTTRVVITAKERPIGKEETAEEPETREILEIGCEEDIRVSGVFANCLSDFSATNFFLTKISPLA